ncbi:MAG: DUF262 domain-containing protein [Oscillospiraceae bacterium]|nr:DUF262 domain-containing protein [Oscillospiraceae bacterium]
MNELSGRLKELKKEIATDSYAMSIGELINLYVDEEMDIHPKFQRLFRWTPYQKTRFIESIMLNIPIPPIFVSQNEAGVWDVVDGVQRLSTIFQFVGKLKDENGKVVTPLVLEGTKTIPEFEGISWDPIDESTHSLSQDLKLDFKRSKIVVNIVKKESDSSAKYELFQRLNTGGSKLSEQEVRNCLMIMSNPVMYDFVNKLSENDMFVNTTPMSTRMIEEQYRMELIVRYLIAINCDVSTAKKSGTDLAPFLNDKILELCNNRSFDFESQKDIFISVLTLLLSISEYGISQDDVFKKYTDKFSGAMLSSAYLTITVGLAKRIKHHRDITSTEYKKILSNKIKALSSQETFVKYTANGVRAVDRYVNLISFGEEYFDDEINNG